MRAPEDLMTAIIDVSTSELKSAFEFVVLNAGPTSLGTFITLLLRTLDGKLSEIFKPQCDTVKSWLVTAGV